MLVLEIKENPIYCGQLFILKTFDILRISEKCQKCKYAKKTQISLDPKKYRYVGICKFEITDFLKIRKSRYALILAAPYICRYYNVLK